MSGITEKNTAEFCTLRYFDLTPSDLSPSMAFAKQHRKPAAPAQQRFRPQQSSRYPNKYLSIPPARQNGFTLIEIAIVMVIITLILSGVLKGQELIDSARVRSLATEVTGIRTAWYSFQDRYRAFRETFQILVHRSTMPQRLAMVMARLTIAANAQVSGSNWHWQVSLMVTMTAQKVLPGVQGT